MHVFLNVIKSLLNLSLQKDPSSGVMEIVPIDPELIQQISSVRIFIPNDLRSPDNRKAVFKSVQQVQKRFGENKIPLLDPVEDMKINEKPFKEIIKKISTFEARLTNHPMHSRPGDLFM
jgi:ATP-dependent RNA helicase DOB1